MGGTGEPPTTKPGQEPILTRAKGWTLGVILFLTALLGCFYILTPLLPFLFLSPRVWRRLTDRLIGFWIAMPGALMEYIFGSTVRVVGHRIDHGEPALIIMNHRTRLDWLFFWTALYKVDPWLLISEKISLKGILKYIPGAGWAMQSMGFIFLDRAFANDRSKMETLLDYYANSGFAYQLLLFPEGTDKCPLASARSEKHAKEKGLTNYEYLLHARSTGFVHMVQRMRRNNYIKYLYDVTIGYSGDQIVQSEVHLISNGLAPNNVHYQIIRIPIEELPATDDGLAKWLAKRWEEKEEKLRKFYSRTNKESETFSIPEGGSEFEMTTFLARARLFIICFWVFVSTMWLYFAYAMSWFALLAVGSSAFFLGAQKLYGGVEWLMIERFNAVELEESCEA